MHFLVHQDIRRRVVELVENEYLPPDDAYERLVDHVLSSPHYGERMARQWLDLARYADSNGFTRDQPRVIWKYRDWVINAFKAPVAVCSAVGTSNLGSSALFRNAKS